MTIKLRFLSLLILCFITVTNYSCSSSDSNEDIENNAGGDGTDGDGTDGDGTDGDVTDGDGTDGDGTDGDGTDGDGTEFDVKGKYTNINGLVVLEAENTTSNLGLWIVKTDVPDYTGTGHIEFTGNTQASGPATSPLKYEFTITETAVYRLVIKSRKRLAGEASDRSNDSYVRMAGDFDQSPNAADEHLKPATKNHLIQNRKVFGGKANEWGWSDRMDLGHDNKRFVEYLFKAGETYTFTVSGRSKNYNIDKIVFFKTSQYKPVEARDAAFPATEETIGQ